MYAESKFAIPHIHHALVSRPELFRKLNEGLNVKLTLVTAQAGYGKTTALSAWAKHCGVPVAWVSLDKLDNDWAPFWGCLIASIREKFPSFGGNLDVFLQMESTAVSESAVAMFLNELNRLSEELVIIMDDYHVIEYAKIQQALRIFLDYLPSHVHLYIASRTDLEIPTARMLAKGELHRIDMRDLQFSLDEGIAFFSNIANLSLTREQSRELYRQTEGWVSGLQLAAISLTRNGNVADTIRQFNGRHRHISDYLLEEVYGLQTESMRQFLLATSVLSRMNRELCEAVTGRPDSQEQLERLEQLNLFVIPLDDRREWYRYHHLLSEFLQPIAEKENPDQWRQFHARAAEWFERRGFDEDAVEHYLKAQDEEAAVRLIERIFPDLMQSKGNLLVGWITVLPESSYEHKPMFELFYISKLLGDGDWEKALHRAEQAERRFGALKSCIPEPEWKQLMGNLYYFCGIIFYLRRNLSQASHYFELLERCLPEGSGFQNFVSNRYQDYYHFTDLLSINNDLHVVEQFLLKWIEVWGGKEWYPFVGYQFISYCLLLYEWNRLDEAERYLRIAMAREDVQSNVWMQVQLHLIAAWLHSARGRDSGALESLDRFGITVDSPDRDLILQRIRMEQARLFLRHGSIQKAIAWSEQQGVPPTGEIDLSQMEKYLLLARVLAARDQVEDARRLIEKLELLIGKENPLRTRIKLLVAKSTISRLSGQTEAALHALEAALRLAEPIGYIRSFLDEGLGTVELLVRLSKEHQAGSRPAVPIHYVRQLLEAVNLRWNNEQSVEEKLTDQEARVLNLLGRGLLNKEIASELNITPDTVKFHLKNIYRKLGVHNRMQAVQVGKLTPNV